MRKFHLGTNVAVVMSYEIVFEYLKFILISYSVLDNVSVLNLGEIGRISLLRYDRLMIVLTCVAEI